MKHLVLKPLGGGWGGGGYCVKKEKEKEEITHQGTQTNILCIFVIIHCSLLILESYVT